MKTRKRLWKWIGVAGLLLWAVLFARDYATLSIPAFGSPEQAALAVHRLCLRYGLWLVAGGTLWLAVRLGLSALGPKAKSGRQRVRQGTLSGSA